MFLAACGVTPQAQEPAAERGVGGKADGTQWCHADLSSSDGTEMVFDYQAVNTVEGGNTGTFATNVWLNVRNPAFQASDSASAVVITYGYAGECGDSCLSFATQESVRNVALSFEDGRFTAPLDDLPMFDFPPDTDGSDSTAHFWELAVVVDGTWYKDPSTGNNLRFVPSDAPGECASGHSL